MYVSNDEVCIYQRKRGNLNGVQYLILSSRMGRQDGYYFEASKNSVRPVFVRCSSRINRTLGGREWNSNAELSGFIPEVKIESIPLTSRRLTCRDRTLYSDSCSMDATLSSYRPCCGQHPCLELPFTPKSLPFASSFFSPVTFEALS